jgi:hypothetical protein
MRNEEIFLIQSSKERMVARESGARRVVTLRIRGI